MSSAFAYVEKNENEFHNGRMMFLVTSLTPSSENFKGSPLTTGEIESNIDLVYDVADIDNNGRVDALTDGLMLLRYLFGLRGASLIDNVIAIDAMRTDADDVEAYIESLMPEL